MLTRELAAALARVDNDPGADSASVCRKVGRTSERLRNGVSTSSDYNGNRPFNVNDVKLRLYW